VQFLKSDPIAQNRSPGQRARWVYSHDSYRPLASKTAFGESQQQRTLAAAGWPGDTDEARAAQPILEACDRFIHAQQIALGSRHQPRECTTITFADAVCQL
jgi:hypothetical protein